MGDEMRSPICGWIAVALLLSMVSAQGAGRKHYDDCQSDDEAIAIAACTRIIDDPHESDHNRVEAYINRGNASD
jgi:hypothetical protein